MGPRWSHPKPPSEAMEGIQARMTSSDLGYGMACPLSQGKGVYPDTFTVVVITTHEGTKGIVILRQTELLAAPCTHASYTSFLPAFTQCCWFAFPCLPSVEILLGCMQGVWELAVQGGVGRGGVGFSLCSICPSAPGPLGSLLETYLILWEL